MLMHFAVCGQYPSNQCTEVGGWSVTLLDYNGFCYHTSYLHGQFIRHKYVYKTKVELINWVELVTEPIVIK